MSYEELKDGVVIKVMIRTRDNNKLVVAERDARADGLTSQRVEPIIWFSNGRWNGEVPSIVVRDFPNGYYLVAIPWNIKGGHLIDGRPVNGKKTVQVLHCARKEHPIPKFKGKVGPITSFVPHLNAEGTKVNGYYVGYHWNGEESLEEIPRHFSGKLTLRGRKEIRADSDMTSTVRRLGVIVGIGGKCVGMELRLSTDEESNERRGGREYHHTRPLLLANCFYVFDGVFTWQPIESNLEKPIKLPTDIVSPLIFLGEGLHLITSTKHNDNTNGEKYRRNVEICPSTESELVSIVDWELFEKDFFCQLAN